MAGQDKEIKQASWGHSIAEEGDSGCHSALTHQRGEMENRDANVGWLEFVGGKNEEGWGGNKRT